MKVKKIIEIVIIVFVIFQLNNTTLFAAETKEFNDITAKNVLLVETDTGKILYEKNANKKIYPASITKLMTAILVMENSSLDEIVTVSENAVISVPSGYVNANLQVGEEIMVEQLLYAMLLPSANDAANALAEHVAGSIESFSAIMNTKAIELGCKNTNFTNPSGLHQKEHYSTAYDLYLIGREAIKNNMIKKILNTTTCSLPSTNKYTGEKRIFTTTNYLIRKSLKNFYCDYCIGGKTGYTDEAQNCVIAFAEKNDIQLTAVVMGENASVKGKKFLDAKEMFEHVFKNYENKNIIKENGAVETIKIQNGTKDSRDLNVLARNGISILEIKDKNIEESNKKIEYSKVSAPISKGEVIGKISFEYEGITYTSELIAENEVLESKTLRNLIIVLIILLFIYIIHINKKSKKKSKRKSKKNNKKKIGRHGENIKKKS